MPKSLEKLGWDQCWHWDNLKPPHGIPYSRYPNPTRDVEFHPASHLFLKDPISPGFGQGAAFFPTSRGAEFFGKCQSCWRIKWELEQTGMTLL